MHYGISQSGPIYDGDSDVNIVNTGTGYAIDWRVHVRIGVMINAPFPFHGSRFTGDVKDFSGTKYIPQSEVDALYNLPVGSSMSIEGVSVNKVSPDTFSFSSGSASGDLTVIFDGPTLTLKSATVSAMGQTISLS